MGNLDRKTRADATEYDGRREPESAMPCPEYQEEWPTGLYEMLRVDEGECVSRMGLVIDLDVVDCRRRSSAVFQPVVVALLLLKIKVMDVRPS